MCGASGGASYNARLEFARSKSIRADKENRGTAADILNRRFTRKCEAERLEGNVVCILRPFIDYHAVATH